MSVIDISRVIAILLVTSQKYYSRVAVDFSRTTLILFDCFSLVQGKIIREVVLLDESKLNREQRYLYVRGVPLDRILKLSDEQLRRAVERLKRASRFY